MSTRVQGEKTDDLLRRVIERVNEVTTQIWAEFGKITSDDETSGAINS